MVMFHSDNSMVVGASMGTPYADNSIQEIRKLNTERLVR